MTGATEAGAGRDGPASPSLLRETFDLGTARGRAAVAAAGIFVVTPFLAFAVSRLFLLFFIPALALLLVGIRGVRAEDRSWAARMGRTGLVLAVNGALLMLALFTLGFVRDFVSSDRQELRAEVVGVAFTIVHVLLGVGLLLVDNYRHTRAD